MARGRDATSEARPGERIDLSTYVVVPVWYGCNNDCSLCMLSGLKERLAPVGPARFERLLRGIAADGRFDNLVLSGAEVTTCPELDAYARMAADTGRFGRIQIQTNGRRLADKGYLGHLLDSGVNEFFVSIQGMERAHDAITRVPGSHRETVAGLENLASLDVNAIPNTVLTAANVHDAVPLVSLLCRIGVREIHLWNYFPMEPQDSRGLVPDLGTVSDVLSRVAEAAAPYGTALVLKSFPECLRLEPPAVFDSWFPVTVLPDAFWRRFEENRFGQCAHRERCSDRECWGLSEAYVRKYGDERERLSPIP